MSIADSYLADRWLPVRKDRTDRNAHRHSDLWARRARVGRLRAGGGAHSTDSAGSRRVHLRVADRREHCRPLDDRLLFLPADDCSLS